MFKEEYRVRYAGITTLDPNGIVVANTALLRANSSLLMPGVTKKRLLGTATVP